MRNRKVIPHCPHAENRLVIQLRGYRPVRVSFPGRLPAKVPVIGRQVLFEKLICLSDTAYPLSLVSLISRS